MPTPRLAYLICATPRSGSTVLCDALAQTGVAGRPAEYFEALAHSGLPRQPREYLEGLDDAEAVRHLPPPRRAAAPPPFRERLAAALPAGTTPNGVFGAKVMWGYFRPVLEATGGSPETVLPRLRYVLVRRRDKLRQAISLWRALQTQAWSEEDGSDRGAEPRLVYSRAAIDHLCEQLVRQEAAWERWLFDRWAGPLVLTYEEWAGAPQQAAAAVLEHLGIRAPAGLGVRATLRRQSDGLTEDWVRRHEAAA